MTILSGDPFHDASRGGRRTDDGLLSELARMSTAFWASRQRNKILMLAAALVIVIAATAYAQVRLNAWNRPFYNALTHKDVPGFLQQLGVFGELAGILLALNVAQTWLNQMSQVVLRRGLVDDLLDEWLKPLRAFRLSNSGLMGVNPDQRLQADAQHLTQLTTVLGTGLLQSTVLLLSFIGVLWGLSQGMFLPFDGRSFAPPGYLVWCALFYAGAASLLSWRVGRPLIAMDANHYAREAELRFGMVRVSEEIEGVATYGGEADERGRLAVLFESVLEISRRIVWATTRLTWVTAGYGWFAIVAPILAAAPGYFSSNMTFGELMMVVGAFNQVQQSLRWYVDNFSNIADWRATLLRIASFRKAILSMDQLGRSASRISIADSADRTIRIDDLRISAPAGTIMLSEAHVELKPGEHILIVGARGVGKTLFFRAMTGLWPWGAGRITFPGGDLIAFVPTRPYVPPGLLRDSIAYPRRERAPDDATIVNALRAVGLERLEPELRKADRWDRTLSEDEKQRLAFARVVLQGPQWVIIDNALDLVDSETRKRIEALFEGMLAAVGIVYIGGRASDGGFFSRTLRLVTDSGGPTFRPADTA